MNNAAPALALRDVSKRYKAKPDPALSGVSFEVRRGETVGLLGPNGAGKTTLLKICNTLLHPTEGSVRIFGLDVVKQSAEARAKIGLVTCDERSFYWRLTGRQNLEFFGSLYGLRGARLRERAQELLEALDLAEAADRHYQGYSSGMKQRLAIARGLLSEPDLIFYDEPTRSLDPMHAQQIRAWIERRRADAPGQTHILATNQLSEAEQLCDRVLIINRGRLIAHGTIREIRESFNAQDSEISVIDFRGALPDHVKPDASRGLYELQVSPGEDACHTIRVRAARGGEALSALLRDLLAAGGVVVRCSTSQSSFDEIFCSLVEASNAQRLAAPAEARA
ncbi:MAG TPA: ABC transporter ATP-binding protein [Solibacterales bacterium]|nr:ABC transporter ATP-binding protein [Bryobacterales bacterium]